MLTTMQQYLDSRLIRGAVWSTAHLRIKFYIFKLLWSWCIQTCSL